LVIDLFNFILINIQFFFFFLFKMVKIIPVRSRIGVVVIVDKIFLLWIFYDVLVASVWVGILGCSTVAVDAGMTPCPPAWLELKSWLRARLEVLLAS